MKTNALRSLTLMTLTLVSIIFSSCDLLNKADDINFDATLEETILVTEETEGTDVAYSKTINLDATTNSDINKYKSKIQGFTVKKISYQIVNFIGPANATFSGTLSFGDISQTIPTVGATVNNLNLTTAYSSGQLFDLLINPADVDKISALLKDDKAVKLYLNGTLSKTPLTCSVRVVLDVSVKADAL